MSPGVFALLTFLAGVFAVLGVYALLADLYLRDRSRLSERVNDEFRKQQRLRTKQSSLFKNRDKGDNSDELATFEAATLKERLETLVGQSGLDITVRRIASLMALVGGAVAALVFLVFRNILLALLVGALASSVPVLVVALKRKARLEKMMTQIPDAFDLMARVIRAGQTMSQAMQSVADEFSPPLAGEFALCYEQQNLGLSSEMALRDLARRSGVLEIKIFVLALLVQQQTGGNLAELLDGLAGVVRERLSMRGKIQALTAEGRMQAFVLLALPPGLFAIILVLDGTYGQMLFHYPSLLLGTLAAETLGALWIRRIVNFDF